MSRKRTLSAALTTIAVVALAAIGAGTVGAKTGGKGKGKATSGTSYLGDTSQSSSSLLYEAGFNTDKLLGEGAITYTIAPLGQTNGTIQANAKKVTLWTKTGSLSGTGSATVTITNPSTGDATVSNGTANLTKGTGALKGHSLKLKFSGTGNIKTTLYTFHYTGTYK